VSSIHSFIHESNDTCAYSAHKWKVGESENKANCFKLLDNKDSAVDKATTSENSGKKTWMYLVNANTSRNCCCFGDYKTCSSQRKKKIEIDLAFFFIFLPIYMIVGILILVGNAFVLLRTSSVLHYKSNVLTSVQHIHNILLLNLATADFLMGLYLSIVSLLELLGATGTFPVIESMTTLCSFLGILNFISSQVSVTMLVIMASFRLQSVRKPYKRVNSRTATLSAALCWFVWLLLALIPVINTDELQKMFVKKVKFQILSPCNVTQQTHDSVNYERLKRIVANVLNASDVDCVLPASPSWSVLITLAKQLQLYGNETLLGFYNKQGWCGMKYIISLDQRSDFYTLTIVSCNFVAFVYIAACYAYILCKTSNNNGCNTFKHYLNQVSSHISRRSNEPENNEEGTQTVKSKEDEKLHKLVALILITDFLCWMPICLLSFSYAACSDSRNKCLKGKRILLSLISFALVPLNSLVNPLLYSERLRNCLPNVRMRIIGERLRTRVRNIALTTWNLLCRQLFPNALFGTHF